MIEDIMFDGKLRFIGLLLVVAIAISMAVESEGGLQLVADIALCALMVLGLAVATRSGKNYRLTDALCIGLSMAIIIALATFNARPMLPGLIIFVVIPASSRLPRLGRVFVYIASIAIVVGLYFVAASIRTIDSIVPLCVAPALAAIIAFTESALKERQSAEESRKLLDELVKAQEQLAETEAEERGRIARREIRRTIGGMLADAVVQLEASGGFMVGEPTKAERLVGKARETIDAALSKLRAESRGKEDADAAESIRIVLAHADRDVGESLAHALSLEGDISVDARSENEASLASICAARTFDLALVDEDLPPRGGSAAIKVLAVASPSLKCLLLSAFPDSEVEAAAREAGAVGVADRGANRAGIPAEIRGALRGREGSASIRAADDTPAVPAAPVDKPEFSSRELQILGLIAKGFSNKEIADRLFLAEGTVKNRVSDILLKIGARDRTNAALKARNLGLV